MKRIRQRTIVKFSVIVMLAVFFMTMAVVGKLLAFDCNQSRDYSVDTCKPPSNKSTRNNSAIHIAKLVKAEGIVSDIKKSTAKIERKAKKRTKSTSYALQTKLAEIRKNTKSLRNQKFQGKDLLASRNSETLGKLSWNDVAQPPRAKKFLANMAGMYQQKTCCNDEVEMKLPGDYVSEADKKDKGLRKVQKFSSRRSDTVLSRNTNSSQCESVYVPLYKSEIIHDKKKDFEAQKTKALSYLDRKVNSIARDKDEENSNMVQDEDIFMPQFKPQFTHITYRKSKAQRDQSIQDLVNRRAKKKIRLKLPRKIIVSSVVGINSRIHMKKNNTKSDIKYAKTQKAEKRLTGF